jgi:apolipoprotein N-acyltransferase
MMFAGYLFVSLALLSLVVDHYDKRNNEKSYQLFFALSAGTAIIWIAFAIMFGG